MNNNTNNSNSDIPVEVLELLPWYAIGKLSVDDQAFFDKALQKYPLLDDALKHELAAIEAVNVNKSILDASAIASQDERLKSVFNLIDVDESQNQHDANKKAAKPNSLLDKLKRTFDTLIPNAGGMPQYARVASVGVLVLSVAVLTAFVAPLFTEKSEFIPASAVPQSSDVQKGLVNAASTVLLVGFKGTSVELGNNDILKDKLLKIQTVPDKEGIFQISFKQPLTNAEIKQTIDALLKQKELVWFAGESF